MRLNPDCIRDILLTVEENTGYRESMLYESNQEFARLKKYSEDVVRYHMKQCDLNGYFTKMHIHLGDPPYQPIEILSLIHISEPTRLGMISYAVFCLKKK